MGSPFRCAGQNARPAVAWLQNRFVTTGGWGVPFGGFLSYPAGFRDLIANL